MAILPIDLKSIDFNKNKKQILIFVSLIALLAIILYFNFLILPQVGRISSIFAKLGRTSAELKSTEADIKRIPQFKDDIQQFKGKVSKYEKMLPAEQEIPSLLETLSDLAKSSSVKIVGITPTVVKEDKSQKDQTYQEIPILINAKSGYHELGKFLSKLENSDRFMKVVDLQIRANKISPKKHDVELLVLTYILLKTK